MSKVDSSTRNYEVVFILNTNDYQVEATKNDLKSAITSSNATIIQEEDMGVKSFAYEIKKHKQGYYYIVLISADRENLKTIEELHRNNDAILRQLVIKQYSDSAAKSNRV